MLKNRILTACVLIPLVVCTILFSPLWLFGIISAVFFLIAYWEWSRLAGFQSTRDRIICFVGMLLLLGLSFFLPGLLPRNAVVSLALGIGLFWILAAFIVCIYPKGIHWLQTRTTGFITGVLVLSPAWIALLILYLMGPIYILYVLVLIWAADIAAYFTGKKFGRHKLAPQVSPGKTWEGVIGALLITVLVSWGGFVLIEPYPFDNHLFMWMFLSLITVLFSIVGDLLESIFKRMRNLKDSGSLLPGHGGMLDRIDSLTAAFPIFLLGKELFGKIRDHLPLFY